MSGSRKVAALDGLRVLAIAAVVAYHANPSWLPGGYLGVTVFFVLTGYLTTLSLEREVGRTGRIGYLRFVSRRVARLLPTMLAVVGVTAVLCALFSPALLPKVKTDAVPALLFFENLFYLFRNVSYFAAAGLPSPLTHFWFLGVTMQFYLVWPLVLLALSRAVRRRRDACVVVALLAIASSVAMALLYDPLGDTARVYYAPDARAAEFLVGALLALHTRGEGLHLAIPARLAGGDEPRPRPVPALAYDVAGAAALAAIAVMAFTLNGYSEFVYRGGILLVALLTAVFVGVVCRPEGGLLSRVVGCGALAALGARSFAVYLWHYPLLLVMNPATRTTELPWWGWVVEVGVILAVAEASYRLFEHTILPPARLGQSRASLAVERLGQSLPALALECLGVLAALVLLVAPINAEQTGVPVDQQGGAGQASQFDPETEGYDLSGTYLAGTSFDSAVATINSLNYDVDVETGATSANVLLIGDSVPAGAVSQYQAIFPNGWIDAQVGRQFYDGKSVYEQCVADGHAADVVVFSLGNNGVVRDEQVRELIDACGPDKKVYFVTARVPLALQDINNQTFWNIASEYDNVDVIDWYAESAGHDEYFWGDGTHLRPEGAQAYVMMIRKAVTGR